jgi:hypothetical protein
LVTNLSLTLANFSQPVASVRTYFCISALPSRNR